MAISKIILNGTTQIDLTSDTVSSGSMLSETTAHKNDGTSITGNIASQAAQTIHPSTTDQTIASGKYLTGTQTVKGVLLTNLDAGNIKKDVVVKVGDSTDDDCVTSVTGTYEGGGSTPTLIHFKVNRSNSTSFTFHVAEAGMTWAEWVASDYCPHSSYFGNTDGYYITEYGATACYGDGGMRLGNIKATASSSAPNIPSSNTINNETTYYVYLSK